MNRPPHHKHQSESLHSSDAEHSDPRRSHHHAQNSKNQNNKNQNNKNQNSKKTSSKTNQQTAFTLVSFLKQTGISLRLLQRGGDALLKGRQVLGPIGFAHLMMGTWAVAGAAVTVLNVGLAELMERQTHTFFTQLRGSTPAPEDIVIVAIDESSLEQGEFYLDDPATFSYFEPLAEFPWQRRAYAIAAERLLDAGAKAVAIDLIFDLPSRWEGNDDQSLINTIETFPNQIVLAASYEDQELATGQGTITQLIEPASLFRTDAVHIGHINYWIELDNRIHRLSETFPDDLADFYPDQHAYFQELKDTVPSFDVATLEAAQVDYAPPKGDGIFYFGPDGTFQRDSFWTLIDPFTWEQHLKNERFKDKIVLIGPTATLFQDLHSTPVGTLPGIEVHANAIATLMTERAIAQAIPSKWGQGAFIISLVVVSGVVIGRPQKLSHRTILTGVMLLVAGGVGAVAFIGGQLIVPTAIPLVAIALSGLSYVIAGLVREKLHRLQLRQTLKQYSSSPIIREIISKQDDLQDLLGERERETLGKLLSGRYQIVDVLGAGGFGETYVAADLQRPGQPLCVVKQLRPVTNDPKLFSLSQRLFQKEAQTLEKLGKHPQIPQLLAYFEEGEEFYLVQEFINGDPLRQEFLLQKDLTEADIVKFLAEMMIILDFIHRCGVIHRDIKPSNIIRRRSDQKLVLIDFGAVKEMQAQLQDDQTQLQTITIGTRGYMPNEQAAGTPRFNSDVYAVGVIGIQSLTGLAPDRINTNPMTGELDWQSTTDVSSELERILTKMTRYSFRERYQSAKEVLSDLEDLVSRYQLHDVLAHRQDASQASAGEATLLMDHLNFNHEADMNDSGLQEDPTLPWPSSIIPDLKADPPSSNPKDS
ncbi:MAG: serine/threonine-protein kinase [Leptolyngbyaceae bacterium]|nr:serine/threonine-protein kinase [Leptolyngbyaceae bacterium]